MTPRESCATWLRKLAVWFVSILLLLWPSFYNGYPFLFPDSLSYLEQGRTVARAVFLHQTADYYGMRSLLYSLIIFPFHHNATLWPVIFLQAVAVLCPIWLTVRCVYGPRHALRNCLIAVAALSLFTALPWFTAMVMPDVLGAGAYLALFLLAFAWKKLSRIDRGALFAVAWFGLVSHFTHLLIATLVCILFAGVQWLRRHREFNRKGVMAVAGVLLAAVSLTAGLNAYLYGKPSLNGVRPPFLMARLLADGPARLYLQEHCSALPWAICEDVKNLPADQDAFLWNDNGIWGKASHEKQARLLQEEMPLALATLRTHFRQQARISIADFFSQLVTFGYSDFAQEDYIQQQVDSIIPGSSAHYAASHEGRNALPFDTLNIVQEIAVAAALGYLIFALVRYKETRTGVRAWLLAMVLVVAVLNALLTGVLSEVDDRYQGRLIWLIPFVALMTALTRKISLEKNPLTTG